MGLFEASDGVFNLGASGEGNWQRLIEVCERPDWREKEEFKSDKLRRANRVALNAALNEAFRTKPVAYWVEELNKGGVPAGPVYNVPQMFEDEQVKFSGVATKIHDPKYNADRHFITQPMILSRTPAKVATVAPDAGVHTDEVLEEAGYSAAEIAKFHEEGVV